MARGKVSTRTTRLEDAAARMGKPKPRASLNLQQRPIAAVLILLLAGAGSTISQLSLSPVYGSIPASRYHTAGIVCTALTTLFPTSLLRRAVPTNLRKWLTVLAWYSLPVQYYISRLSGYIGPVYGALATEMCTYYPLLLLSLSVAGSMLERYSTRALDPTVSRLIHISLSFIIVSIGKYTAEKMLPSRMGTSPLFTRYGLQVTAASSYSALGPISAVLPSLLPVIWVVLYDPHFHLGMTDLAPNKFLESYNYTLLERKESLTGYISVLESHVDDFRVLRCDHSLLGGDWLVTERSRKRGLRKRETVYSVFTMLEAVRLVERHTPVRDGDSSALFIGLGIGTSPKAFIEHGINTTIVELDPVVHNFATKYFELPSRHHAYLQDAVPFVRRFSGSEPGSYDYIVHDVFTGGAEPTALFTLEFLQGLEALLKTDGVIAINYVADLSLPASKIVIRTILEVFPTCRIFRDTPVEEAGEDNSFVNMIVFCTKRSGARIKFREASEADWLGSISRRQWIPPKENLEMSIERFLDADEIKSSELILRKGEEQKVEKYHHVSAERHWRIMRTVLPDAVWELW